MKKGKARSSNGLLPNSLRIISSCLKTVSTNASSVASTVRSAGASVASSISSASEHIKDQVIWAGFDRLQLGRSAFRHVLLLGYKNGFQVLDVEDTSNFSELVSRRDSPVSFLQIQPIPVKCHDNEEFRSSHPLLLVVAGDESLSPAQSQAPLGQLGCEGHLEFQSGNSVNSPTSVRFYSLRAHSFVHVLRFRSAVLMVRCSPRIVAVGLATQVYCFDALTLENKFSVLTYPMAVPQLGVGHGAVGVNIGYGPLAVGPRWLAYASNNPLLSNTGRLSPQNLSPSPGVSPSTSPGTGNLVARYAMESSKQLAAGLINLGDMGYKTLSKYYQDLLPDGSNSPASSSLGLRVGRLGATEADNAGMVVIKDFVSRAVISQFKAHTSPISALCFDPSGTLLVTASVHGNNINIFRIMPSSTNNGSTNQSFKWSSSHVHLYKLYRGITTAIIQDICFSHYSQWVAVVSSKGTCHVYILSPFGGDTGFQTINNQGEGPQLSPALSLPWWLTSSCTVEQQSSPPPPPPVTISVVSRIKNNNSGWLNPVTNVAGSASITSGAVAAVFHNSTCHSPNRYHSSCSSLEHLLVYTPCGHVIQYELLPSLILEPNDSSSSKTQSGSILQLQDEDLRVKVHPIQWWDVCRRSDLPERETLIDNLDCDERGKMWSVKTSNRIQGKTVKKSNSVKINERSHWYLSNAEVQISSRRIPIWQKSKIFFHMMDPPRGSNYASGEFEIEKVSVHEVEIKRKDLLPVFDHFYSIKAGWNDRCLGGGGRYQHASSLEPCHRPKDKGTEEVVICHSKPASLSSTESSDGGSSRRIENLLDLDQLNSEKSYYTPAYQTVNGLSQERIGNAYSDPLLTNHHKPLISMSFLSENSKIDDSHDKDDFSINDLSALASNSPSVERAIPEETSIIDGCHTLAEAMTDDVESSSSHCEREQPAEADGENDEMLGSMFAFSEEG